MSRYQLDAYDHERIQAAQEELQANADACQETIKQLSSLPEKNSQSEEQRHQSQRLSATYRIQQAIISNGIRSISVYLATRQKIVTKMVINDQQIDENNLSPDEKVMLEEIRQ